LCTTNHNDSIENISTQGNELLAFVVLRKYNRFTISYKNFKGCLSVLYNDSIVLTGFNCQGHGAGPRRNALPFSPTRNNSNAKHPKLRSTSTSTRNYGQLAIATEKLCTTGAKTNAKNETLWNAQPPQPNNLYNSATNSRSCPVSASPPALLYPYKFFITRSMSGYKAATGLRGGKTYIPNLQSTTVMGRPNFQLQVRVGVAVGANFGGSQRVILRAVDDR
jgi:hypothetical protein